MRPRFSSSRIWSQRPLAHTPQHTLVTKTKFLESTGKTYNSSRMAETPTMPRRTLKPGLGSGIVIGAIAACLLTLLLVHATSTSPSSVWSKIFGQGRSTSIASQTSVVERVQSLQRMETVVFNMDKVVTGEKGSPFLPDFLVGDRMLMVVHGQVVAGVDFSQFRATDVQVAGRDVHIKMPAARVLLTRIDNARTRVYSRSTGLLVPVDPNFEGQVRQQAEGELLEEAMRGGILTSANQNARNTLVSLLLGLGFEKVNVD
jgi:hypothetical protein